ncbi:MAG: hypothetical protein KDD49_11920, partial [Bacteroidetes bacterium]|nr:hypothetical protein [Bacteroidota bacterium]
MNLIVGLVKERLNSGVDFGLYESQYYNDSATPDIMIPVFRDGNASIGPWANVNTMTLFNYANNGIDTIVNNNNIALHNETGAIYGVAFQPKKNRTFSSAFAKRHVGFGPQGSGGVYIFEDNGSGQDLTGSFSLQGVTPSNGGIVLDFGTIDRVDSPGGNANYLGSGNASRDEDAYGKVGNVSYGDIDVYNSDKLYMINLFQRRLIVMDVSANTSTLNNASVGTLSPIVDAYEIVGANGVPSCTNGEIRPFGLTFHQGKGYMGIVCDGELDNKFTNDNVVAYVLSFDPSNIGAGFTEELSIPMSDYRTGPQNWRRWSNTYSDTQTGTAGSAIVAPQPILSDIDFDINGDMIVGFMDRFGHQIGSQNYEPGTNNLINGIGYGEILRVCKNGGTWEIEGTGTCPVNFTDSNNIVDSYSGLGEYYNDAQGDKTNPYNGEASNGAFASLMGSGQILSTVMDPYPSGTNGDFTTYGSTGGVHWFNHTNGSWDNYLRIYNNTSIGFRKSHGLGDIEILTSTPPLEIGNRVWEDTDGDGIQDPDELGLDGVTVHLYDGATLVGTTTTANGGQWYFNDGNVLNNELLPNTTYTIRIVSTDFPSGETLTLTDSDGSTNGDLRDNDASLVSGNAEI